HLVRPGVLDQLDQRELIEQVGLAQVEPAPDVLDPLEVLPAGPAHHAAHGIAFFQQEFRDVGAVLPGDAGDQCPTNCRASLCRPLGDDEIRKKTTLLADAIAMSCWSSSRAIRARASASTRGCLAASGRTGSRAASPRPGAPCWRPPAAPAR